MKETLNTHMIALTIKELMDVKKRFSSDSIEYRRIITTVSNAIDFLDGYYAPTEEVK